MVTSATVSTAATNDVSLNYKLSLKRDVSSDCMVVNILSVTISNCNSFIVMFWEFVFCGELDLGLWYFHNWSFAK